MTNQILKVILGGILAGTLIFFFPFILPIIGIFFLIGLIFRLVGGSHRGWGRNYYNEKFKNMTAEERKVFFEKYGYGCYPKEFREVEVKTDTQKI
ncbi:MAG: hypothetical protein H7Y00_00880 [Fimbriimonadaceae bacterium]|nr:hypothetical protein [Chitinophagales bacterium]